jgi:hypothetical protein
MTALKKFFLAYSKATNAALHLMKNAGETATDLLDLNDEDSVSLAKEQIEQGFVFPFHWNLRIRTVDGVLLVLNKNILGVASLASILGLADKNDVSVILILPDGASLPTSSAISTLDTSIQGYFRQIPIPFMPDYSKYCWKKVFEYMTRSKQVY